VGKRRGRAHLLGVLNCLNNRKRRGGLVLFGTRGGTPQCSLRSFSEITCVATMVQGGCLSSEKDKTVGDNIGGSHRDILFLSWLGTRKVTAVPTKDLSRNRLDLQERHENQKSKILGKA